VPSVSGSGSSLGGAFRNAIAAVSLTPRRSYKAKSPVAQARQLAATRRGSEALRGAGVHATRRTQRAWLTGKRQPNKANRQAIGRAYDAMKNGGVPPWVKNGKMKISGQVSHGGKDVRDRGHGGNAPLLVDLRGGNRPPMNQQDYPAITIWDAVEDAIASGADDDYLDELIGEELLPADDDLGGYSWGFPGGAYSVGISG
jgi:hypothetical protein